MAVVRCKGCARALKGDALKIKDYLFHPDCFRCSACGKCLAGIGYYQKEDAYFCRKDFKNLFSKACSSCGSFILGDMVSVLDRHFHQKCFFCHSCRVKFTPGMRVTYWNERFYCITCFARARKAFLKSETNVSGNDILNEGAENVKANKKEKGSSNNLFEGDGPKEKSVTSNLSNQAQDDLCSDFCKELAKRLAVQYSQCESHVSDGTNRKPQKEGVNHKSLDSAASVQPVKGFWSPPNLGNLSTSLAGDSAVVQKEVQNQSFHIENSEQGMSADRSNYSETYANSNKSKPRQPIPQRSHLKIQSTGKVAAIVKLLESAAVQKSSVEKVQNDGEDLSICFRQHKGNQTLTELQTEEEFVSDMKMPTESETSFRTNGQDSKFSCRLLTENPKDKDKRTYLHEKISRESARHDQLKKPVHMFPSQTIKNLACTTRRKSWPPVMLGTTLQEPTPTTSNFTPFSEVDQSSGFEINFEAFLSRPNGDRTSLRPDGLSVDAQQFGSTVMNEQNQFELVDEIRQRNYRSRLRTDMSSQCLESNEKDSLQPVSSQHQRSSIRGDQKKPSARCGSKTRRNGIAIRGIKWILCKRNKKISVSEVTTTVSKMMKHFKLKTLRKIEDGQKKGNGNETLSSYPKFVWTIAQLLTAGVLLIAMITTLVWISDHSSQRTVKPSVSDYWAPNTTANPVTYKYSFTDVVNH
ncbi:hypothetical protein D915_009365 [Fasciola hepatica]|uniref:LIM zinc-binding domain-containing protein n=1 Tax=Fasciola hepatica TaxID=6192 RepID=A0A4E0QX31_FASHE|nr:hypothetical protein D915_009365 [Fasciola hepatica]